MPKFYTFGILFLIIGSFSNIFGQTFTSSNLPIIVVSTEGQTIADNPKVNVKMGIIDNGPGNRNYYRNPANNNQPDPFNNFNGTVGIEHRGSSSQFFPKKPYGFETRTETGDDLKVSLLGMPKESDWILNASYTDKTLMRDVLTYHLSNQMGMYATRTKFVELVIDGDYKGVYILMEKIKRDANRVNIASLKPADNSGDALTGGYILKVDKNTGSADAYWKSPYPANNLMEINIMLEYPKKDDITTAQFEYIKNHFTNFEHTLNGPNFKDPTNGYAKYIDVNTFVDYFLLTELTYNIDAYRLSVFFYKDRDSRDSKIKMGPAWDYDHSYGNANYCKGWETNHWAYDFVREFCPQDDKQTPTWWARLLQDREFCLKVRERWQQLRQNQWTNSNISSFVNQNVALLGESQVRNFQRWPLLGEWIWPNYYWGNTYQEEIDWFKNWTEQRLSWLDANIPRVGALANEPADCASVTKPTVSSPVNYCIGQTASALSAGGVSLKWYTQATGGTGNTSAPTPATSSAGTTSYYVTQTINNCESTRAQIDVIVASQATAPTATTSIEYCQGQTASALTANGSNLKWYTAPFGGTGVTNAPTPSTSAATLTSYFVSQTVNGCESSRTQINVNVKNRPDIPHTVASLNYCQGQTALQLSASGTALLWYTVATGGTGSSGAPIPSTSTVGTNSYFVSQTLNGCESNRAEIKVNVGTKTTAPSASNVEYCQGQTASPLTAVGNDLLWYTSSTGGESSTTAPTPSTASPNILSYFVSQTISGCESNRTQVMVTIRSKPSLPEVVNPPSYCQGDATNPLSATGSNLKWYDIAVGGTASSTAPSPSSATARTVAYYVSQTVNSCESSRAMIPVTIKAKPAPPTVSGSVSYTQGQAPSSLSATGSSLKWYSSSTGGTGNLTAPTPSTTSIGSTSYYVTQTVNGCESDRSLITVLVSPPSQVTACIETKVLLEGAMNGTTMHTKLNQLGLLPGQTPKDALATKTAAGQPYKNAPWNYPGSEGSEIYSPDVVDWVLVSLRTSPEEASSTIFKTSGLLFKDGTVQTTGACPVVNPTQTLFVAIEHRNHIGAVSHDAVAVVNNTISYDFTKRQSYVPAGLPASGQLQVGSVFCLFAADSYKTSFAEVNANDASIWLNENGKFGLYKLSDFNLDGEINANDNSIWRRNNGKFSGVKF
ncbi:hypothetical protein FHS57_002304 [Runella defluvii]|uniref:Ig-like domain-containing protein n=1 Tax=Runella defluvii TaxID=370973 RepID=A0A7W5ZK48_9BACT|nr:CotH kinase family protein [Runella defluvii]MBB3838299.1 hypothetical protein [Runella defluvii]